MAGKLKTTKSGFYSYCRKYCTPVEKNHSGEVLNGTMNKDKPAITIQIVFL